MTTTEQQFDVAPHDLFTTIVDPTTYPHWLTGAKDIREVSPEWPQPASWFRHVVGFGPLHLTDKSSVVDVTSPSQLVLLVRARPVIEAKVTFDIAADGTGAMLTMTENPVGVYKVISLVAQPLIRARNERSLRRLRAFIDADADAGTSGVRRAKR